MQITLVNSNFIEQITPNFMLNLEAGLLSLGGVLVKANYEVNVVNLSQLIKDKKLITDALFCSNAAKFILKQGSDILGFNSRCDTYPITLNIARQCKQSNPKSVIIIGGPQATFTDYETLEKFSFVDVVVRGEGELTILELMNRLKEHRGFEGIPGVTYRENGKIIKNKPRELIKDLNSLPLPAYSLLKGYQPAPDELKEGWAYIAIGRGCPYNCTFCSTGRLWQRYYRLKSPGKIIEEVVYLQKKYGIRRFYLGHDNLFTNKEDVKKIAKLLLQKKINIEWTCSSRIDSIDAELLKTAASSGCKRIFFGVESGSPKMQKIIKKNIKPQAVLAVIEECRKFNIFVILSFIMGFPEEREKDINATLELAMKSRVSGNCYPYIRPLTPIAGTELFLKNRKRLSLRDSWSNLYLIGSLIRKSKWSMGLIKKYPSMFSNFYSIKPKYLPVYLPYETVTLFSTLICAYPRSIYIVLEELKLKPLALMDKFRKWAKVKKIIFKGKMKSPGYRQTLKYFPVFLKDLYNNDRLFRGLQYIMNCEKQNCDRVHAKITD
ncbi:MAG: radical SAM protein [Candidatus Omnitrophota bacterium]